MSTSIGSRLDLFEGGNDWGSPLTNQKTFPSTIGIELVSPPAEPAVTLAQQKNFSRVDGSIDDAQLERQITMATEIVENLVAVNLITRTYIYSFDGFVGMDEITLPYTPVSAVDEVASFAEDNTKTVFASSNYFVDRLNQMVPARVVLNRGAVWPTNTRDRHSLEVRFQSGVGNKAALDADTRYMSMQTAILTIVQYWNEEREGAQSQLPEEALKIIQKYNVNIL